MKSDKTNIIFLWVCMLFGNTACTGMFESLNTNNSGFDDEKKKEDYNYYGIPLGIVQQGIYYNYDWGGGKNWPFQIMQNLSADMFCGYMHDHKNFNSGRSNTTYNMMDGWNGTVWDNVYGYIFPEVRKAELINKDINKGFYGITLILKVELMHRVSDIYGPIIYTKFGNELGSMPDTQEEAYNAFFKDLDQGIKEIEEHIAQNNNLENFAKFDILMSKYKRNYVQWIKFANSLRLRLAVRIAMADPSLAATEAKKALNHTRGLLESSDDLVAVSTSINYANPLGEINKAWNEAYMNANMESIMGGYEDPRLEKYFMPATARSKNGDIPGIIPYEGTYKGIRQGTGFNHLNYIGCSRITIEQDTDAILMTAAEVWFLRAEAALRGWSAESVKECYERGIRTSFFQWNVEEIDEYLKNEKRPKDFIDALDPAYNIKAVNTVTPKWNETASNEEKLEKIIVQKWIACYPEGCEAWAEYRRTGYPKLFPVLINDSPVIDSNKGPRRLNFYVAIRTANPTQYEALLTALGGADNCATNLWWDKGRNF
ncbi:SusD/RagB family nutrient-binding outer membrane lipoprotein [Bacteroides sp. 519]|uniref:SusD/RagB family nutrient-binding outer membrane lipoprotein n=1 Tax=Bacteroides sp. 519 TaxID=2302937 RepID=UPI0013CFB178|nr:SusD/RagB family nutrient-binding outer membrane lipoprotein [Bacteroides sp. 519]NDV57690.1 SusD/RagB family nutrient-binding outer membrane lipoprotein [Bacteroides sp. 519]